MEKFNQNERRQILILALLADVLSAILVLTGVGAVVEVLLTILIIFVLGFLFHKKKALPNFILGKKSNPVKGLTEKIIVMIVELIPGADLLPGYTFWVWRSMNSANEEALSNNKNNDTQFNTARTKKRTGDNEKITNLPNKNNDSGFDSTRVKNRTGTEDGRTPKRTGTYK